MKKREELIKARNEALAKMSTASKAESFVQADFDNAKNEVDKLTAQIEALDIENKFAGQTDEIISIVGAKAIASKDYRDGFDRYIAGADMSDFKAAMTEGVPADGGYIVPQTYQNTVLEKLNTLSLTRSISTVLSTSSTSNIPIEGEAPTFAWINEGAAYGETKATFGNTQLGAYKLGGIIKVSDELLNDTAIPFETYMANQIAKGIDKAEAPAFCNGDGNNKPTGYLTSLAASKVTASQTAITADEIIDIYHALPEAYRNRATWRMNDSTIKAIRKLKNSVGDYLFSEALNGGTPMLLGRPIVSDSNMPSLGTGNKFIVFGDFSFYQIANRGTMEVRRLNERFADTGLVGFRVTVRVDAKRMLDEAFVCGQNA